MIVIPTEKKFDWHHTPIVLFLIVLLNILVFFLYQTGDSAKEQRAFSAYLAIDGVEIEWPIYQDYLKENSQTETSNTKSNENEIDTLKTLYKDGQRDQLAVKILIDRSFYPYLVRYARNYMKEDNYDAWFEQRAEIEQNIASISSFKYGLTPSNITPLTVISHQFLHGGLMHLLGNLFFLVICGFAVEASIGHARFFVYYLVGGVIAGLSHALLDMHSSIPLVGASGAISGVMAMYLAVFRFRKIEFFYWFFAFVGYFRAPALFILPFYMGKELYSFYSDPDSNVAFMAHAGGFIAGAVLISVELLFNRNMLNTDYIEDDQTSNPEQEALAQLYEAIGGYRFKDALGLLDEHEAAFGESFDTRIVRYNLCKIQRGENYNRAVLSLFRSANLSPAQIEKVSGVLTDNFEQAMALSDNDAIKLARLMSDSESLVLAEKLFAVLIKRGVRSTELGVLAKKISLAFQQSKNKEKQQKYTNVAEKLLAGGSNDIL